MSEGDIFSLVSNAQEFDKDQDAESTILRLRDLTGRERMAFGELDKDQDAESTILRLRDLTGRQRMAFGELCHHLFQRSLPQATRFTREGLELTA